MKKKTLTFVAAFLCFFLSKTTAQTHLDLNKLQPQNLFFKGGDSILQKKNLLFLPKRDVTQKRNLLYQPSVEGKPSFKLLDSTSEFELGFVKKAIAK